MVNKAYRHSSYRGVTGIGRNDGYFDCNQWSAAGLPEREKGILHTVGSAGLTYENMGSVLDGTSNTLAVGEYMTTTTTNRGTFWAYSYTCYALSSIQYESRLYLPDFNLCGSLPGVPSGEQSLQAGLCQFPSRRHEFRSGRRLDAFRGVHGRLGQHPGGRRDDCRTGSVPAAVSRAQVSITATVLMNSVGETQ